MVRQNTPDLQDIKCVETVRPVELGVVHGLNYIERFQNLLSDNAGMKKRKNKAKQITAKRYKTLNAIIEDSATPEEGLTMVATFHEGEDGAAGLNAIREERKSRRITAEKGLRERIDRLKSASEALYTKFHTSVMDHDLVRDREARSTVCDMFTTMEEGTPPFPEFTGKEKGQADKEESTENMLSVRNAVDELVSCTRSERFINAIVDLGASLASNTLTHKCSSPDCRGESNPKDVVVGFRCGHMACRTCLEARSDDTACVDDGCGSSMRMQELVKFTDIDPTGDGASSGGYGRKMEAIIELLRCIPQDEQAIMFVSNEDAVNVMERILSAEGIQHHSLSQNRFKAAKALERFKKDSNPKTMRKVLILNSSSELAAGANLSNANHVLFASPFVTGNQQEYDSAMAQAIARCRRYGQKKEVRVYHFAAVGTIDMDILERRRRFGTASGAMWEEGGLPRAEKSASGWGDAWSTVDDG